MKRDITEILVNLRAKNRRLRREATIILGKSYYRLGSGERDTVVKAFLESIGDPDETVRFWSATLIKEIFFHANEPQKSMLVQALAKLVTDENDSVRTTAMETTCRILFEVKSSDLQILLDAILARVSDTSSAVRDLLVDNLKRACHVAGPKQRLVLDALTRLAHDSDHHVRRSAMRIVDSLNG